MSNTASNAKQCVTDNLYHSVFLSLGVLRVVREWSALSETLVNFVKQLVVRVTTALAAKQLSRFQELQKVILQAVDQVQQLLLVL
jgi:hypothetical protein